MAEVFNVCYDEGLDHLSEINLLQQLCLSPQSKRELAVDFDGIPTFHFSQRGSVRFSPGKNFTSDPQCRERDSQKKKKRQRQKGFVIGILHALLTGNSFNNNVSVMQRALQQCVVNALFAIALFIVHCCYLPNAS